MLPLLHAVAERMADPGCKRSFWTEAAFHIFTSHKHPDAAAAFLHAFTCS